MLRTTRYPSKYGDVSSTETKKKPFEVSMRPVDVRGGWIEFDPSFWGVLDFEEG